MVVGFSRCGLVLSCFRNIFYVKIRRVLRCRFLVAAVVGRRGQGDGFKINFFLFLRHIL